MTHLPTNATRHPVLTDASELQAQAVDLLQRAQRAGATQAAVSISLHSGFSINVRKGEVDTLEHQSAKGLSLSVFFGHQVGIASTSDFHENALQATLEKACHIARFTQSDPCMGLADAAFMAYDYPDLALSHPWEITPEAAITLAKTCESIALSQDKRIQQCDGASVNTSNHWYLCANTHGFVGYYPSTMHSLHCSLIAQDGSTMQSSSDYTCNRDPLLLSSPEKIATHAAEKVLRKLGARRISTRQCPVIFKAAAARTLISHFLSAISGGNLYSKSSFLLDHLGKQIFPSFMQIEENPHIPKSLGASPFDSEGVKSAKRTLIQEGILQGYLLGSYSARKLNMQTTGNADGAHELFIQPTHPDLETLLKAMHQGLLVTNILGQGVNIVTGDYSRGIFGFWVENGEIQHPVHEVTIASNLKEIFARIVAIGNDIDPRSSIHTGSIWVESMQVAGG